MNRQLPVTDPVPGTGRPSSINNSLLAACYKRLFSAADIIPNGSRPWDILIHDARFYRRILMHGSVGPGESYMDGWWEVRRLDKFSNRILRARFDE